MTCSSKPHVATRIAGMLMLCSSASLLAVSPPTFAAEVERTPAPRSKPAAAHPSATPLPVLTPSPPYIDRDDMARQPTMQELGLRGHVDIGPMRERADRKPRDWKLQALVGQMDHLDGDRARAEARYQRAVDAAGTNDKRLRHVLWSRGWARLYSGDNEGALLDWRDAAKLHGGKPEWYPHTLALAYWRAGQRAVGMQWFEASGIASHPEGSARLPYLGLPLIAQGLIGDMFAVRRLRAEPGTLRLAAGAPALEYPAYIASPLPKYPAPAVSARRQGRVIAYACVNARGDVTATQVAESSGHADLDKAATGAIAGWQFRPLMCGGKPRDSWAAVPIDFAINGGGVPLPNRLARKSRTAEKHADSVCESGVGLDPAGFTAVVEECWTHIVCSADAVWTPNPCKTPKKPASAAR